MGKQKKHKKKMPEEDKNNVAYYKKKNAVQEKEESSEMQSTNRSKTFISPMSAVATSTPISKPTQKEEEVQELKKKHGTKLPVQERGPNRGTRRKEKL